MQYPFFLLFSKTGWKKRILPEFNSTVLLNNILFDAQNRIKSMAIIHEMLYLKNNFSSINFKDYINDLIQGLKNSYTSENNIVIDLDIDEINLDMDNSVTCGLILNELFTNSLKYAFTDSGDKTKVIRIILKKTGDQYQLIYRDNGRGLPENINLENINSVGLYIIDLLVTGRLQGTLELKQSDGLEYRIKFTLDDKRKII